MNFEAIIEFFKLNRSSKVNILLIIFASLISGYIILFIQNPAYWKGTNWFQVILLSLAIVAPIYIIGQVCATVVFFVVIRHGLRHIATLWDIDDAFGKGEYYVNKSDIENFKIKYADFVKDISFDLSLSAIQKLFINSPTRQLGELFTICSTYPIVLIGYCFNLYFLATYLSIIILCVLLALVLTYWVLIPLINIITLDVLKKAVKPYIDKLRKNNNFMTYLDKRLTRIEDGIKKRGKLTEK